MSMEPQYPRRANRVDPHLIFGISLFVALAVSSPALSGAMRGTVDIVEAGVHLLVAEAIAWAGCYGIGSLLYSYSQTGDDEAAIEPVVGAPLRRTTDAPLHIPSTATTTMPLPVTPEIEAGEAEAA
ncbi:MAG TPA: hypothetical protein VGI86_12615 [Acidimicrobiia bacterium]|jgi:hypothetical protein